MKKCFKPSERSSSCSELSSTLSLGIIMSFNALLWGYTILYYSATPIAHISDNSFGTPSAYVTLIFKNVLEFSLIPK